MHQCDEKSYYQFKFYVIVPVKHDVWHMYPLKVLNSNKYMNKRKPKKWEKIKITYRLISHIYRIFMYNSLIFGTVSNKAIYFWGI